MVKKVLLVIALALPMIASAQTLKIGLVDFATVLQNHPETAKAQSQLQDAQKKYEDEYNKLGAEMQRLFEDYQKNADALPAIKERKERELQEYQTKLQNFEQSAMNDLQKMQADLMQPILKKIQDAVQAVGKEGGFSLIQDYNQQITLYYDAPVVDITPQVRAKLGM